MIGHRNTSIMLSPAAESVPAAIVPTVSRPDRDRGEQQRHRSNDRHSRAAFRRDFIHSQEVC